MAKTNWYSEIPMEENVYSGFFNDLFVKCPMATLSHGSDTYVNRGACEKCSCFRGYKSNVVKCANPLNLE